MAYDSTSRFTGRVENYAKYRPGYPDKVLDYLQRECHLTPQSIIADIGSGTGIFTRLLLDSHYAVYAVEPNESMRREAERQLRSLPGFHSVDGTAEQTTLDDQSVDLIVCAQAFHWFHSEETKEEFKRILAPQGCAALIWNNRRIDADDFSIAYELLLKQQSGDYQQVSHLNLTDADFANFYRDGKYALVKFPNYQVFGFEQLAGRAFSSSYVPAPDTEAGHEFNRQLKILFDQYQTKGSVKFSYETEIYLGGL
jgi:ubiquinone/menaquinone biosynthesis C-methylase UbiE